MYTVTKAELAAERQQHREGFQGIHGNRPVEVDPGELRRQRGEHRKILDKLLGEIAAIEQARAIVAEQVANGSMFPAALTEFDLRINGLRQRMVPHQEHVRDLDDRLAAIGAAV